MKNTNTTLIAFCLAVGYSMATSANSQVAMEDSNFAGKTAIEKELDAEYEKLVRLMKERGKPVQVIDGVLDIAGRPGIGPKDAPVILVEFGDFQCAFCRRHLLGAAQQINEKLVRSNQVRYVFLDFPVTAKHPLATQAAAAARCAEEQAMYWKMRNSLYTHQKALHKAFLVEHAKRVGLDETLFKICLESGRYDAAIWQDKVIGKSLGVKGTPTFFLGINHGDKITLVRKIQGVQPYQVFEREILRAANIAKQQDRLQKDNNESGT